MNRRTVLTAICSVMLFSNTYLSAAPVTDPTEAGAMPRAKLTIIGQPFQPQSGAERAQQLREIQAMYRAAAEREVQTIAAEMQLDPATGEKLLDITLQNSTDSVDWSNSLPDLRDHGLTFARSLAA